MPLYEVTESGLNETPPARFAALGMYERRDLQRLLRENITPLGDDLLVIAEEFGRWQDARRRIDLLALDKTGRLVVIEIKRTDDGGQMELQALRYAAMVSSMTFEEVVTTYAAHCARYRPDDESDARAELETFLDAGDGGDEAEISSDVRIILVSADFGREITTTVLWLNGFGVDVRCVRLVPYDLAGKVVLDIQQVLPLPEAGDYQVRIRQKDAARDRARGDSRDLTRFHIIVNGDDGPDQNKRQAILTMVEQLAGQGVGLADIGRMLPGRAMRSVEGLVEDKEALGKALSHAYPGIDVPRYFCERPLLDRKTGHTYVLTKMWGRKTEYWLAELAAAFPDAAVTFRKAESDVE